MLSELNELVWDHFNSEHISKHGITQDEVTQACTNHKLVLQANNNRLLLIGKSSSGKLISVVLANKGEGKYYPVTARATSRKERRLLNEKSK